jgi:hypothetical protein
MYRKLRSAGSAVVGKPGTEGFRKNIISVYRHRDLPLGQSDMSFPRLNTRIYSPDDGAGAAFAKVYWRRRVRTDRRRDEGVGAGGGQLGSSARARRSLGVASPARALSLPWGRGLMLHMTEVGRSRRSGTFWRRRSFGSPAAGKARYGGFLEKFPYPPSFEDRRLDPCVLPTPSIVGTRLSIGCLRQCA